jgi:outer membrane receptor for ferrienterochelin and colicin
MKKKLLVNVLQLSLLQLAVAPVVLAQSNDEESEGEETARTLDTIQVTGSRIPRAGFDTLEPATAITREAIDARGITNIADILNEGPTFGVGATPEAGQSGFGVGVNFANQFGLGTARTLSLINGRRVASSNTPTIFGPAGPGLQVDLNIIPVQIVDRVPTRSLEQ